MFSKVFILISSFLHSDADVVRVQRTISVSVPEDEIVIENIRPEVASMYY
jgi:hypothetical protein